MLCLRSLQWMEKSEDGPTVFRSQRAEERQAKSYERERERRRENLFMRLQDEFEKECLQPGWYLAVIVHQYCLSSLVIKL